MNKKTVTLILIFTIFTLLVLTIFLVPLASKSNNIFEAVDYETNLIALDINNSKILVYTEYNEVNLFINDNIIELEKKDTLEGIELIIKQDNIPKNEIFDIKIEFLINEETVKTINLNNVFIFTVEKLDELLWIKETVEYLVVANTKASGNIDIFKDFTNLKYLDLGNTPELTGDIISLSNLDLQYLVIGDGNLTGNISSLIKMDKMKYLYLDVWNYTPISGDISALNGLFELRYLKLVGLNNFGGEISELENLKQLTHLELVGCWGIEGNLKTLLNYNNLEYLDLHLSRLRGNTGTISSLKNLKYLNLKSCNFIWGNIKEFEDLRKLKSLNLGYTESLAGNIKNLSELEALEEVNISKCPWIGGNLTLCDGKEIKVDFFDKANPENLSDYQD